jgi:hypothetical protein
VSKIEVEDLTITDLPQPEKPAISGVTPTQIGSITGVDAKDTLDRAKMPAEAKLLLLAEECRGIVGRDPRGGGFALVGRPRVIMQLMVDADVTPFGGIIRLQRAVVIATSRGRQGETVGESDIIGWWQDIPIALRSTTTDDKLHCMPLDKIPRSLPIDRQQAGRLRIAAHNGGMQGLILLREDERSPS